MNKIKDRARRKAALSDRKSAAAQARMKSIAHLAADERVPKKRRKVGGGEFIKPEKFLISDCTFLQRTCLVLTTRIGPYTAKS